MSATTAPTLTGLDLTVPPEVVGCAVAQHGVRRPVDVYRLPDLWAFHLYGYDAELVIDGIAHRVRPGTISLVPPGATTEYRYRGPSRHRYAHLRAGASGRTAPMVLDPDPALGDVDERFTAAIAHATIRPERTRAELWLALLRATTRPPPPTAAGPDHVTPALAWIEANLDRPVTVPDVAVAAGVSHTHLTRLVRERTGRTVVGWIRHRRIARAVHLLQNSTLSVAAVAASVGLPDLQAFNKACRRETGLSPRALRAGVPGRTGTASADSGPYGRLSTPAPTLPHSIGGGSRQEGV